MARFVFSSVLIGMFGLSNCGDDDFVSCEDDVLECSDDDLVFEIDPSCSAAEGEGTIEVVVGNGDGEGGFRALAADELPEFHYGSQGGRHVWVGVQIRNPNLERPLHRIELAFDSCYGELDCTLPENWISAEEYADEPRVLVVDDGVLRQTADGWLEIRDVLVFVPWNYSDGGDSQQKLLVAVEDSCGRVGEDVHLVLP